MNTLYTTTSKFLAILILSIGLLMPLAAQFKKIEIEPSTSEEIKLKPLFKIGQSEISPDKQIPLNFNSLSVSDLVNAKTRIVATSFDNDGNPIFFKGAILEQKNKSIRDQVGIYLENLNSYFGLNSIANEYQISSEVVDEIGMTHISIQQTFMDVPVENGEIKLHAKDGIISTANGKLLSTPNLQSVVPAISQEDAEHIIESDFQNKDIYKRLSDDQMAIMKMKRYESNLVIINEEKEARLAYKIDAYANIIQRYVYYIDALDGSIIKFHKNYCSLHMEEDFVGASTAKGNCIHSHNHKQNLPPDGPATANAVDLSNTTRSINTYEVSSTFYMLDASRSMFNNAASNMPDEPVGVIWTLDAGNTNPQNSNFAYDHVKSSNNSWNNKTAVSAHYNGGIAFEYFQDVHSRNSINGEGGNIISLINISDPMSGGGYDNAFWNGVAMFYGNGDQAFDPLAESLDVAGHEMSHGVVQATANLTYQGESGAMNEGFADIFGSMMDRDDWFIGEDITKTSQFPTGKLRDMSNPHNGGNQLGDPGWQPDNTSEQYKGSKDNGGVHINSGIVNHAYYKFAETAGIGKEKAEKIFYRALTVYLSKSSQFVDLRASAEAAAKDLYGDAEKDAASTAFAEVGIGPGGNTTDYETDVEMNPGEDFLLHSDENLSNIFVRDNDLNVIADPLTDIDHKSKPSITDNGTQMVFVGSDSKIYLTTIDWGTGMAGTQVFDDQAVWRNVAISKDGSKIAALTNMTTNLIIVFDFDTNSQQPFELYNPTFTEGVSTGDVDFADAMEFDFNNEMLMYDAQSTIKGATGDIVYWDIGFIKVYDNQTGGFGNGQVQKLFTQLPEGTSIGNPTFSKNSPYIVAFDLIAEGSNKVMGANIESNVVQEIFDNGGLGYPSFNNSDNQIVYELTWLFGVDIGLTALEADKITPQFNSDAIIVESARLPVVFSNGERDIVDVEEAIIEQSISIYPNPTTDRINLDLTKIGIANEINVYDAKGALVYNRNNVAGNLEVDVKEWNAGTYTVRVAKGEMLEVIRFVKF